MTDLEQEISEILLILHSKLNEIPLKSTNNIQLRRNYSKYKKYLNQIMNQIQKMIQKMILKMNYKKS